MPPQLHRRLPLDFVTEILRALNDGQLDDQQARFLLGIGRSQLYELRRRWLWKSPKGEFTLSRHVGSPGPRFHPEIEQWLHEELSYIRDEAEYGYRRRFNFAFLADRTRQRFHQPFHRNSLRRWAIQQGYYQPRSGQARKVYTRFEKSGIGVLFQHDSSHHVWLPCTREEQALVLTQDDHSRRVVGGLLVASESAWAHLCVARQTLESFGLPLAYYVDQHSIFRFVVHGSRHKTYHLREDEGQVQFRRALQALGVGIIYANSPPLAG